ARMLALLDPLLCRAATVVETDDLLRVPLQVGDNETDPWEQFAGMPLHFRHHAAGLVPRPRSIAEAGVELLRLVRRPPHGPLEQVCDLPLQHGVGLEPDRVAEAFFLH